MSTKHIMSGEHIIDYPGNPELCLVQVSIGPHEKYVVVRSRKMHFYSVQARGLSRKQGARI